MKVHRVRRRELVKGIHLETGVRHQVIVMPDEAHRIEVESLHNRSVAAAEDVKRLIFDRG